MTVVWISPISAHTQVTKFWYNAKCDHVDLWHGVKISCIVHFEGPKQHLIIAFLQYLLQNLQLAMAMTTGITVWIMVAVEDKWEAMILDAEGRLTWDAQGDASGKKSVLDICITSISTGCLKLTLFLNVIILRDVIVNPYQYFLGSTKYCGHAQRGTILPQIRFNGSGIGAKGSKVASLILGLSFQQTNVRVSFTSWFRNKKNIFFDIYKHPVYESVFNIFWLREQPNKS